MKISIGLNSFNVSDFSVMAHGPFWRSVEAGEWEPETFAMIEKALHPKMTFLDLGAWIGPTTLFAAQLCHRSIAIEPDPVAYSELVINVSENPKQKIGTRRLAVLDYDGWTKLGGKSLGDSMTRIGAQDNVFDSPCNRLRTLVLDQKVDGPLFIKMDVEGSEEFILREFDFFEDCKPTVFMTIHRREFLHDPEAVARSFSELKDLYNYCYETGYFKDSEKDGICRQCLLTDRHI